MRIILFCESNLNIDISNKQVCSNRHGKMRHCRYYTSQHEYKRPNIETDYYII